MAEMLLINPSKRGRKATAKRRTTRARRRNPITSTMPIARKRNPIRALKRRVMRRRRNPAMLGGMTGYMTSIREALMGGVGAVAFDVSSLPYSWARPSTV